MINAIGGVFQPRQRDKNVPPIDIFYKFAKPQLIGLTLADNFAKVRVSIKLLQQHHADREEIARTAQKSAP